MTRKTDAADDANKAKDQASTNSTHTPGESDQSGAGNTAGPAGAQSTEELMAAGAEASRRQMAEVRERLREDRDAFRATFPKFSAAIDAWEESDMPNPTALRIISKVNGFRRAGVVHSMDGVDHGLDVFTSPAQLEQLFSDPNLVVSFVIGSQE